MATSNNPLFNSIVKELYCPDIDLSEVSRFNIYKALSVDGYYNNCIQLNNSSGNIICQIYINYRQFNTSEAALDALVYGYHFYQSNNKSSHSVLDWSTINANTYYNGDIQMTDSYKNVEDNPIIADIVNFKNHNSFAPFFNINSAILKKTANSWCLFVKDYKGIEYKTTPLYNLSVGMIETPYGILNIRKLPKADTDILDISAIFDSADGGLNMYKYANIDLSLWKPTIGDGLISNANSIANLINGNYELAEKHRSDNCFITWNNVHANKNVINLDRVRSFATIAKQTHTKFGIVFMPSNLASTNNASHETDASGDVVYYHIPTWALDEIRRDESPTYHPKKFSLNDTYTGNSIYMYDLDWRGPQTRRIFKDSCTAVVNELKTTSLDGDNKKLIDYIDYVKVAFIGTWGEGVKFNCQPSEYPSADDLIDISTKIIELFQGTKAICLFSLASFLNHDFPQGYREHIFNGSGYYYDSLGAHSYYVFQETTNGFQYNETDMNNIYLAHKEKPLYLECTQYISSNNKPSCRNLINYAKYFRGTYFNVNNIFNNPKEDKFNSISIVKELSRYVGTKIAILSYFYKTNNNMLQIGIRVMNCGTSKIYHSYWKLKYHVGSSNATISHTYNSDFDLRNIPAAFEEDAPNWHDAILILESKIPLSVLNQNNNCIFISIEDEDGICENLYFSNSDTYMPRTSNGLYKLFEYQNI